MKFPRSVAFRSVGVAVAFVLLPSLAFAGRYELVKGKGVEVCEAYKRNLESFHSAYPMICARKVNPEINGFEKPVWKDVDTERDGGRTLLNRVLNYQHAGDYDQFRRNVYSDVELSEMVARSRKARVIILSRTDVDIDNDGKLDDVLVYRDGLCPDTSVSYFATNLFVLKAGPKPGESMIDANNPVERLLRHVVSPEGGHFTVADLFRYKGTTYIDKYCAFKNRFTGCDDVDILVVFKMKQDTANEICRYKFHKN